MYYLENSNNGPEQGIKILPVRESVSISLWGKLTPKEMHPKDTE